MVNANPRIAPIIQFNELLGLGATAAGAGTSSRYRFPGIEARVRRERIGQYQRCRRGLDHYVIEESRKAAELQFLQQHPEVLKAAMAKGQVESLR